MIVCICNHVTERQICSAIDAGADTFDALQFRLGVALACGKCEQTVRELLTEHKEMHPTPPPRINQLDKHDKGLPSSSSYQQ